ncbi:hypothetical protein Tco_0762346 [Tanacetum coccineum]
MMGELTYFLGLQIKQDDKGISICQEQYTRNLLKKYEISDSSSVKTPMALISKDIRTQTMLVAIWIEKAPQVPVKYLVENWFVGVPRNNSQWLCPQLKLSMLLLLGVVEFWSTVVAFDPFPSTDELEKRPLKEFLIKFSVLNGQIPLTLDFHTFCSSSDLNYNNGKYVDHPTPEVLDGNYSSAKQDPSKVTNIELTAHMIVVHNRRDSVSPPPLAVKPKKGKSQTVASTLPKDITSTTFNKGATKTTPRPEGSLGDKDLEGNIPPANMEPIHTPVAGPSGIGDKYQAFLLSKDKLEKESDEEEVLAPREYMDEDIQADEEVRTPSPKQDQPEPSYASIDQYYDENITHRDQNNKLVEASLSSIDSSSTTISDLYKGLDVITQLLKDINNVIKDDPATNQKINEATETFTGIYSNITEDLNEPYTTYSPLDKSKETMRDDNSEYKY